MPKARVNKKKSWLYQAKLKNVRKRIKRLEHKAERTLGKEETKEEKKED